MTRAARRALPPAPCLALAFLAAFAAPASAHGAATAEISFRLRDLKVWQSASTARVDLAGAPNRARPGEPELPVRTLALEFPAGARVTAWQVIPQEVVDVPVAARLAPLDAWTSSDGRRASVRPAKLPAAGWFPEVPYGGLHVGFLQGHAVATVSVRPVQYDPAAGRLRLVSGFRLRVEYDENTGPAPLARVRRTDRTEQAAARALGTLGLPMVPRPNARAGKGGAFPLAAGQYPGPLGREAAYIIVSPDSLAAAFQPLADWKSRQGTSASVVKLSTIAANYPQGVDLPEKIRLYLQDAYRYQGAQWVLLGGGASLIPPRYATSQLLNDAPVPTDIYYSCLDGNWNANGNSIFAEIFVDSLTPGDNTDMYPELYVGRAPVQSASEAALFVAKTLKYDQVPEPGYLDRQLLCAEVTNPADYTPGDYILYDGALLAETVLPYLPAYDHVVRLYENNDQVHFPGCIYETREAVLDSIDAGYNMVMAIGHGYRNTISVGSGTLLNADMRTLSNGPRYSYMVALDCTSAAFDFDCIGTASLTAPTGGAFAFWGSTREDFPQVTIGYLGPYWNIMVADSASELGQALALCRVPLIDVAQDDNPDRWTQMAFVLLGDPSVRLRLRPASAFQVSAPASFAQGTTGFPVTVLAAGAPAESALVCVSKPGDDVRAGYTDATGQVTLPFSPDSLGAYQVTVTARNFLPWTGAGTVVPAGGAFLFDASATKTVADGSTPPQNGNGNGAVDAGETVQLGLGLGNRGIAAAAGVTATLTSAEPGVAVSADPVAFGSIPAGGTAASASPFVVSFPRSLADGRKVRLTLHATDLGGDARDEDFTLPVAAPVRDVGGVAWTDSAAGAQHFTLLRVTLRNLGSGAFRALGAVLRPASDALAPLDTTASFGDLAAGAASNGSREFRLLGQATAASRFWLFLSDAFGYADTVGLDLAAPHSVTHLAAQGASSSITLAWFASPDSQRVAGYFVYRSASAAGPFARANSVRTGATRYFSDAGLAPLTPYFYYVTAVDSSGLESPPSGAATASTNPLAHTGWPVTTGTSMAGSPLTINFDHATNGSLSVLTASDGIYAWHADGSQLRDGLSNSSTPGLWIPRGHGYPSSIAVADLFHNGHDCVVGVTQDSSLVIVWDDQGNVMPGWPHQLLAGFPFGSPAVGDIDGDGAPEIVVGCGGYVYAWHRDGTEVVDGDHNPATNGVIAAIGGGYLYGSPALADLDRDGKADIIIGGSDARMHAIRYDGTECRGWPIATGGAITGSAAVADLDLDGHLEVVFPSTSNFLYCVTDSGTARPGWPLPMRLDRTSRSPSPALADLDGDGYLDVIEATTDGYMRALNRNGANLPGWSSVRYAVAYAAYAGTSESSPVVADIDGDGQLEVLEGAEDATLYGFRRDGTSLAGFPIRIGGEIRGTPLVWDVAGTGRATVVAPSWDKNVYAWDYPGGFSPLRAPWPMFRHDDGHTGLYTTQLPVGVEEGAALSADAGPEGIQLRWLVPAAATGPMTWNVYRREDAGAKPDGGGAGALEAIPADFQRVNDAPVAFAGGVPGFLDRDVRGGRTYVYILETLVSGRRAALTGPLARSVPDAFLPAKLALGACWPNPSHGQSSIRFQVPAKAAGAAAAAVRLGLFDVTGRAVRTLQDGALAPGTYTRAFDGRNSSGEALAPGVYFYRLTAGGESLARKLLLIR